MDNRNKTLETLWNLHNSDSLDYMLLDAHTRDLFILSDYSKLKSDNKKTKDIKETLQNKYYLSDKAIEKVIYAKG